MKTYTKKMRENDIKIVKNYEKNRKPIPFSKIKNGGIAFIVRQAKKNYRYSKASERLYSYEIYKRKMRSGEKK